MLVIVSGYPACDTGWTSYGKSCYKYFNDPLNWAQAKNTCEANGSHLVTFNSAEENEIIYKTFAKGKTLWIGLYRNPVYFTWVTDERVQYTNWISIPSTDNLDEKCVEMTDYSVFHGKWNDNSCNVQNQGFICEKDHYFTGLFTVIKGVVMDDHVISEDKSPSDIDCVIRCLQTVQCKSVNVYTHYLFHICQLNDASSTDSPSELTNDDRAIYYEKIPQ
ncbi:snaclec coagulation factor IX/factor X-binding protein subunit B-like [Exaiptasia diaphana]|uniref:Uncharacterized protein n=1 Tax=Exaiptasia diaphana TaxID=2652724 RepID=A0A913WS09_EXADI|nr:snaclec coagulation factor IX/factor X-binding protein subunit B-like [Exaiptasia diaphana]